MPIIENLTRVTGRARAARPDAARPGYTLLTLAVDSSDPVPDVADLVGPGVVGTDLDVSVRDPLLAALVEGSAVELVVARTGDPAVLARPHPLPGQMVVDGREVTG
ncbi:hypothetical protein [Cellulomonas sp. PhB143]|uniref:hypothetical protein n=1 Tax=Cellulomonas sp. PhB143 TaxID=2485186 RepID=UPI000F47C3EA|nr:hypothetical protein [Cellulomonas sp. PhB143]ROS75307.1 hypothetical protein EDF32_1715 [Cellulomonas sp. PhB143]